MQIAMHIRNAHARIGHTRIGHTRIGHTRTGHTRTGLGRLVAILVALLVLPIERATAQTPEPALAAEFVGFIAETYLNGDLSSAEEIGALYGERVGYYGQSLARPKVIADKLKYNQRWPKRSYVLDLDSLKVVSKPNASNTAEVRFEYDYTVSDARETRRGRGVARLKLTADEGRLVIVAEDGKVLKRF